MIRKPTSSTRTDTLFPYATLFRSLAAQGRLVGLEIGGGLRRDELQLVGVVRLGEVHGLLAFLGNRQRGDQEVELLGVQGRNDAVPVGGDRKSTRLNSSH